VSTIVDVEGWPAMTPEILTDRLRLRAWLPTDRAPFAALNVDPRVMEHFVNDVVARTERCAGG
jgi:RimJ/RimL family protein N-acetyltransferase